MPDEDQTDLRENQKDREVFEKDRMFNLPDLEFERTVRGEILQARSSKQKALKEEATDRCFERKVRDERLAGLLQNHPSRFSNLGDRLLEQRVRDSMLAGPEEE